jgi:hypothetical protein
MTLVLKNLGSKILGSPTQGESSVLDGLGETEVCEFEVSVCSNQNIFGFEVAVDDIF